MPELSVGAPSGEEFAAIVEVWRAANTARGLPPTAERLKRVGAKIASPDACLVVARRTSVLAMALAEPGRQDDGHGPVIAGQAHISMIFVHPSVWGRGVGGTLLDGLHREFAARNWTRATVWTRETNAAARGLYESRGYLATSLLQTLPGGEPIVQYARGWAGG